jgi:TPR repeat protein
MRANDSISVSAAVADHSGQRSDSVVEDEMAKEQTADELFARANAMWEKHQNKAAFQLFTRAAELGSASAKHNVGYFYDEGIGTKKNFGRALSWYKRAWRTDRQSGTCINIAKLYESRKQPRLAVAWLKKAVAQNDGDAALELAKLYLQGNVTRQSESAAALLRLVGKGRSTEDARKEAIKLLKAIEQLPADGRGAIKHRGRVDRER